MQRNRPLKANVPKIKELPHCISLLDLLIDSIFPPERLAPHWADSVIVASDVYVPEHEDAGMMAKIEAV